MIMYLCNTMQCKCNAMKCNAMQCNAGQCDDAYRSSYTYTNARVCALLHLIPPEMLTKTMQRTGP